MRVLGKGLLCSPPGRKETQEDGRQRGGGWGLAGGPGAAPHSLSLLPKPHHNTSDRVRTTPSRAHLDCQPGSLSPGVRVPHHLVR